MNNALAVAVSICVFRTLLGLKLAFQICSRVSATVRSLLTSSHDSCQRGHRYKSVETLNNQKHIDQQCLFVSHLVVHRLWTLNTNEYQA